MNNERDRSQAAAVGWGFCPHQKPAELKSSSRFAHLAPNRPGPRRAIPKRSYRLHGSMLSVVPAGHPDLRELVVGCHRDPTVRSGTIWALGSTWLLNDGGFSMPTRLGSFGAVGSTASLARDPPGSQKLADTMDSSQRRKSVLVQLCCRLACLRDRLDGDGSTGLTRGPPGICQWVGA